MLYTTFLLLFAPLVLAKPLIQRDVSQCPGYQASNVQQSGSTITAQLTLAGSACNAYGTDLSNLTLRVEYQTDSRLHVLIEDPAQQVYQVPESVLPRPPASNSTTSPDTAALQFTWTANPFSFAVRRKSTNETLFDTAGQALVFESQYLRLRTALPPTPYLYGLGESSDPFLLNRNNGLRTLWSRDAYGIPSGSNLYGNHPIYFDHRGDQGTHGVFLLNSNGMDVRTSSDGAGSYLEYNTLGGVVDLYFLAGPSPPAVAAQYAEVVGRPAMMPYWGFGFHQCRYGYQDVYNVAEVVYNYSQANIPLETMWTDIDYMDLRRVFTLDPERFPLTKMRELVTYLHAHAQQYIVMVDPAVAALDYPAYNDGVAQNAFLKRADGSLYLGVVWPGPTVFPDWFNPATQTYWNGEFETFFNADTGVDIDALWIDMNEASNFCPYPCNDPAGFARSNNDPPAPPPVRGNPRPLPGFPGDFQPNGAKSRRYQLLSRQSSNSSTSSKTGLPNRDLLNPPYRINNYAGILSQNTLDTDLLHAGGYTEYDTHNLYGTMMSSASRTALLARRPTLRPLVITRSTFAGAGAHVGHWLGDNFSYWAHYRISISGLLQFASLYQVPMVGSDVCGYGGDTNEQLCARWAMLGAFYPFYRNHNAAGQISQEFYVWESVAAAARRAIDIRYRLLDYLYTAFERQASTGAPLVSPLWFLYPGDEATFPIDLQFFYGDAVLVSPVTDDGSTSVTFYLPDDVWYDWYTHAKIESSGASQTLNNVDFQTIPLHIRGGSVIPLRAESANTTKALRQNNFEILVAPGRDGSAAGSLYLDEGTLLEQPSTSDISFSFGDGKLDMAGNFGYDAGVGIERISVLGYTARPSSVRVQGSEKEFTFENATVVVEGLSVPLTGGVDRLVEIVQ